MNVYLRKEAKSFGEETDVWTTALGLSELNRLKNLKLTNLTAAAMLAVIKDGCLHSRREFKT
jgi:hypothetical protein